MFTRAGTVAVPGQRSGARRALPRPAAGWDPLPPRRRARARTLAGSLGPWALAAVSALVYGYDAVGRYRQGATLSWDLGLFTEAVKQYAHLHAPIVDARAPGFDLLGEHFHPILALLAPFFALAPTPVTLLVAQAVLFGLSVVPVLALARERLGSGAGFAVGAAYGTSFGIVQAVDFDFHELAFAVPLIALALLALQRDRSRLLVFACAALLCTKEEFGVTVVLPLGIAWALRDSARRRRGVLLAAAGLAASLLQICVLIPALSPDHAYGFLSFGNASADGRGNAVGLTELFTGFGTKAHLLLLLGLVTAFTALASPLVLLTVPDLLMRFASSDSSYWGTSYHYNAVLMPILFAAAVDGIARIRARDGRITALAGRHAVLGLAVAAAFVLPFYALGHAFGSLPYAPGPLHLAALHHAEDEVPQGESVEAGLDVLAPLAAKADAYWIGNAMIDPAPDYVVFDGPAAGENLDPGQMVAMVDAWHPLASYTVLSASDGVYVLRLL